MKIKHFFLTTFLLFSILCVGGCDMDEEKEEDIMYKVNIINDTEKNGSLKYYNTEGQHSVDININESIEITACSLYIWDTNDYLNGHWSITKVFDLSDININKDCSLKLSEIITKPLS